MVVHRRHFWARALRGLEWIAAAEISALPGVEDIEQGHRSIFFSCENDSTIRNLRCVDDVYELWAKLEGLDHTRLSLDKLRQIAVAVHVPEFTQPNSSRYLKVAASFLGKRNYSRYDLEEALGRPLAARLGLEFVDSRTSAMPSTLRIRLHLVGHHGILGSSLAELPFHRRTWRIHTMPGLLHPPLASAMALLADLHPGQIVYDPFAGTGTVLIEAGLSCQGLLLSGTDVDAGTIAMADDHAKRVGINVSFTVGDSAQLDAPSVRADRVLSNPPWGKTVSAHGFVTPVEVIKVMVQHLCLNGRLVAVADQALALESCLKDIGWPASLVFPVRVAGCLVDIGIAGDGPVFPENDLGRRLSTAWAQKVEQSDGTESDAGWTGATSH